MEKVYAVMFSCECDDSYYPDYENVYCVCSTKEKADRVAEALCKRNKGVDPCMFNDAWVVEYVLDDVEELEDV